MVTDADRSQDFYRKALWFEPVSDITVGGQNYSYLEGVDGAKIRMVTFRTKANWHTLIYL